MSLSLARIERSRRKILLQMTVAAGHFGIDSKHMAAQQRKLNA